VTVRVTTLKGSGAGRYYTHHLPSYYLDGDEPPGQWWGKAAGDLGLQGEVTPEAFHALLDGKHPVSGDDLGRRMGEVSVRGFDATFSAPKSVSVLFALGDETIRDQVVDAHEAAVNGVMGWIQDHAHTRLRVHGHVMCVDTEGIVVGLFRQHTSRRLDPQLHTHAVIANRVLSPDGRWLALDARTIKLDQRTLSALYHANLRAELTGRLGVRWQQPEHGIAEIADMPVEVLAEFSQRSTDIDERMEAKLARFKADLGRDPTPQERWRLEREAVIDSRPSKPHGTSAEQLRAGWRQRTRGLGRDPELVVRAAVGQERRVEGIDQQRAACMVDQAMERLEEQQSSWRPAELLRELAATTTAPAGADQLTSWLDGLVDHAVESRCVDISCPVPTGTPTRRDGRPITEPAVDRTLTTQAILDQEHQLVTWAEQRSQQPPRRSRRMVLPKALDSGQVEVATAVAQGRNLELVVGPAGAGKTTALSAAAFNLSVRGRTVFGVAPTAAAAEVLATETGIDADTLDKLLVEHSLTDRPPRPEYDLASRSTVIVDEAGTAPTPKLAELARLADEKDWRIVMVGDPRQFSAVGRGGMFAHLVDTYGATELGQVHRFRHEWERRASLQLRNGHSQALDEYDRHGRLHGGSALEMEAEIVDAWAAARTRGETVALMANSNQSVNRLNRLAQMARFTNGEISIQKGRLRLGEEVICVGDEVVTRRNARTLLTDEGNTVKNRDHWTVQAIHSDGSVTLTGHSGTLHAPADYVANDVRLGYAQTSHATQGRTVDTALVLIDYPTDSRGVYTPMTRGREANHAYVITDTNQSAVDVLNQAIVRDWIDQPTVARRVQADDGRSWNPMDRDANPVRTDSRRLISDGQWSADLRREQSVCLGLDR
jgi:conjugative relaxase-like TrwC/TraI family protein